jgi:hypothetical protein
MKTSLADTSRITGWGVDADRENDPTWPMRDQSREDGPGMAWTRPTLQSQSVEVLQSIEHNRRPRCSAPPPRLRGSAEPSAGWPSATARASGRTGCC